LNKIGLVIGQLGFGGAEKQAVLLAQGLMGSGQYEPIVFCLSNHVEPYGKDLNKNLITWYQVPENIGNRFQKILWLCKQTRETGISLLYGFLNTGNVYVAIAGLINRLPFVCSIRNADSSLAWWLRILSGWSCNRADLIIANSASCLRSLRDDLGVQHSRVRIIENALDFHSNDENAREKVRAEWGLSKDAIVIGTVSNLKKQKNPLYFVEVFKILIRLLEKDSFYFVWIGDGPQRYQVDRANLELDADLRSRILFPGSRSDISNVLKAFDVFILTSSYEGLPNALMEAMSSGLPCVATNVLGTRDILSGANDGEEIGVLASPSNPQEFAIAVFELLANPARMKKMGISAQGYVHSRYSLEKMVLAHCEVFDEILAHRQN
jgi:L-malate glycosyltransferase